MFEYYSWTWCRASLAVRPCMLGNEHYLCHAGIWNISPPIHPTKGGDGGSHIRHPRHNTPQKFTRKRRLAGNLSDLRHGTLVWRPCWISGGYRLEAASRPIALYIVGIREAQGRNQHFMSGTGTWSSGFWLAMADCLGRFGRASHSTSRYHTPPRSWDKSTMHVQCEA